MSTGPDIGPALALALHEVGHAGQDVLDAVLHVVARYLGVEHRVLARDQLDVGVQGAGEAVAYLGLRLEHVQARPVGHDLELHVVLALLLNTGAVANPPSTVLVMTDDQGWGDTGYNGHPHLKTPNLDKLAREGVRFDRFYAAHFNCSPTRGSVLTGRHPNRYGTFSPGAPIRAQEITIAQVAKSAGYATGHFGKWHLNGVRGPGQPIPKEDPLHPGRLGFDEWVSASNFIDLDTRLARNGASEQFEGDSSDSITDEALKFIRRSAKDAKPFLALVWFGSPHSPHRALAKDRETYKHLPEKDQHYYGELTAVDRSVGRLREALRELGAVDEAILWFCSDNGGAFGPLSTGHLRGTKGTLWEGGVRVPGLLEWPGRVKSPVTTNVPCSTSDIFPTLLEAMGAKSSDPARPLDGISLLPLIEGKVTAREKPIAFWDHRSDHATLIAWPWKLHQKPITGKRRRKSDDAFPTVLLYDLSKDPKETIDLADQDPERVARMELALTSWQESVKKSFAGGDYPRAPK